MGDEELVALIDERIRLALEDLDGGPMAAVWVRVPAIPWFKYNGQEQDQ